MKLLADANDVMHLRGAKEINVSSKSLMDMDIQDTETIAAHINGILSRGIALRSSQETERNSASSRSHAVCTVKINRSIKTSTDNIKNISGSICLVDLAGSERNYETLKMSAGDHLLSADINTALMSLKDCFRVAAANEAGEKILISANNHFSVYNKGASQDPMRFKKRLPPPKYIIMVE